MVLLDRDGGVLADIDRGIGGIIYIAIDRRGIDPGDIGQGAVPSAIGVDHVLRHFTDIGVSPALVGFENAVPVVAGEHYFPGIDPVTSIARRRECNEPKPFEIVGQHHIRKVEFAVVLHRDGVGNVFAHNVGAISGYRCGLGDRNTRIQFAIAEVHPHGFAEYARDVR